MVEKTAFMEEIRELRDIKKVVGSLIKDELFQLIYKKRSDFLKELDTYLDRVERRTQATDNPAKQLGVIEEELQHVRQILTERRDNNLADVYLNAVKRHTLEYAENVVVSQGKSRFERLENDSSRTRVLKFLKRTARILENFQRGFSNIFKKLRQKPTKAYGPWTQDIPFRNLVEFHLTDIEVRLKQWADNDHSHMTSILIELEEFLAEDIFNMDFCAENHPVERSLENRTASLRNSIRESIEGLEQELSDGLAEVYEQLVYFLERAGTLERRSSYYNDSRVERKSSRVRNAMTEYQNGWNDTHQHLLEKALMVKDFLRFREQLEEESQTFLSSVEEFFQSRLSKPLNSLREDISGIRVKLGELQKKQEASSAGHLLSDSEEVLKKLIREIQGNLEESIQNTDLSLQANSYTEQGLLKANGVSEQGLFIEELNPETKPPDIEVKIIEWRILLVRSLKEHIFNQLQPSKQHYENFLVRIRGDLEEVLQVIEVNMESALELFGDKSDEAGNPFEMAVEALERTDTKLSAAISSSEEKYADLQKVVLSGGRDFCTKMLHLVHTGDTKELQVLDAKYKVKQTTKSWQTRAAARWARIQDSIALFWRFGWKKLKSYVNALRKFLGFEVQKVETVAKIDVATYLSETDTKIKQLPYIYRRLFDFGMATDRRFYVALNENFAYLKKAHESWESGFPATFAVIGEKGSGKTTYLNFALEDYFSERELRRIQLSGGYHSEVDFIKFMKSELDLEDVDSLESIIAAIQKSKKRRVLIIENLQNFYLRNINGYGAIESLLYVISETKESIFWILSCSVYAWNYLNSTMAIGEYFSHFIRTDMLNEQQIEAVIMNRHRSSGYELVFEPSEAQSKSRAFRKIMDQEEASRNYLKEVYFEELTRLSEGNASIAMIFWIRSIREFDDTHFFIKPLEVTALEMIQELKPEVLFTLAAIVLHDTVTPKELSAVLQFTEQESRLMLMRLKTRGLLRQEEEGEGYLINQLMYRQIVRVLKERNIIHLV